MWPLPREIHREAGSGPVAFDSGQISLGNIGYYEDTVTKEWLEENIRNQTEWLLKKQESTARTKKVCFLQTPIFAQIRPQLQPPNPNLDRFEIGSHLGDRREIEFAREEIIFSK